MKKTRRMTVRLTQAHWKKLEQMADATNATPSDAMRFLVENADTMFTNANSRGAQVLAGECAAVAA